MERLCPYTARSEICISASLVFTWCFVSAIVVGVELKPSLYNKIFIWVMTYGTITSIILLVGAIMRNHIVLYVWLFLFGLLIILSYSISGFMLKENWSGHDQNPKWNEILKMIVHVGALIFLLVFCIHLMFVTYFYARYQKTGEGPDSCSLCPPFLN
ncbi:uncharacterized protein Dana_GF27046 [Drosophila ananassae]|uniref:Uncharacterized protein n=1 Tax=Drosophila ananassae TaxID=7217 RepID=A0A0P8XV42_DROAN|nr:uncharacterized protein LOC26514455 isoform X2 [Drosophila ananassae]KPU78595.1 uncharacterized protein Dana_GF27046 [Drosophila ananassae]